MIKIGLLAILLLTATAQRHVNPADCPQPSTTRIWTPITPAVVKTRVEPSWPLPGHNDTQGVIVLDVWIDEKGTVSCVKVTRSIPLNDRAAIEAVRQWKFAPATLAGRPVAVVQEVQLLKRMS